MRDHDSSPFELDRRSFLHGSLLGLGGLAANSLLTPVPLELQTGGPPGFPTHPARAKRVLLLYMLGGPSQYELFDHKPLLDEHHGEDLPARLRETGQITTVTERQGAFPVVAAAAKFDKHGESGMELSNLVPNLHRHADRIALIRSMQTDSVVHERANVCFMSGTTLLGRPSMGSWITYGLGSEAEDLPEFVVLTSGRGDASGLNARMWGNGFLPRHLQGVQFHDSGAPVLYPDNPPGIDRASRESVYRGITELNEIEAEQSGDPEILTRLRAFEKTALMQVSVPELADLKTEDGDNLERYGADPDKPSFARNALLARRLLERGVRFVLLCDRGWDQHFGMPKSIEGKCKAADQPIGALLDDLHQRGLLDDTLVVFAGEFGRTPYCEGRFTRKSYGRDHNNRVGSMWMAGGGIRGGVTHGVTDEWGWDTVQDPVHVNDLQATILHCLGVDHLKLTYRFEGRDMHLTNVAGRVVPEVIA